MPNLSLNIPKYVPQRLSLIGTSTLPPTESSANILSASLGVTGDSGLVISLERIIWQTLHRTLIYKK